MDASTADWIAAIGQAAGALFTAAAVGWAVFLARREGQWRREDQAERAAERADRDAAQARLITVEHRWEDYPEFAVRIRNGSIMPILDVQIAEVWNDGKRLDWTTHGDMFDASVIGAGEGLDWPVSIRRGNSRAGPPESGIDHVTVEFTDAGGLRWRRRDHEPPSRLIDPPTR